VDSLEKIERKRQARHRLRAQRERAARLKTRVVAISLICFALLWGIVFTQMATGNDPVLGDSPKLARRSGEHKTHPTKTAPPKVELPEAEPVEEEFVEEEPAPVTTSQS
jgi:hypothetical protein